MRRLQCADRFARELIGDRRGVQIVEQLPDAPARRKRVRLVIADRLRERIEEALIGVRCEVDDDVGAWRDAARLFDIQRRLKRTGIVAGCAWSAIDIDQLEAMWIDL